MGDAHVMYVYNDALRSAGEGEEIPPELAADIGRALVKLCLNPDAAPEPDGMARVTWESIKLPGGTYGNALNWVDGPHSSDVRAYLWADNTLAGLRDLDLERLEQMRALIENEIATRAT